MVEVVSETAGEGVVGPGVDVSEAELTAPRT